MFLLVNCLHFCCWYEKDIQPAFHKRSPAVCFFNLVCPVLSPAPHWTRTDGTKSKRWEGKEIHLSHISWQDWVRARRAKVEQQFSTYVMLLHHEGICHDTPGLIPYKETGISDLWCYIKEELSSMNALPSLKKIEKGQSFGFHRKRKMKNWIRFSKTLFFCWWDKFINDILRSLFNTLRCLMKLIIKKSESFCFYLCLELALSSFTYVSLAGGCSSPYMCWWGLLNAVTRQQRLRWNAIDENTFPQFNHSWTIHCFNACSPGHVRLPRQGRVNFTV